MARPRRSWLKFWAKDVRADPYTARLSAYEWWLLIHCWDIARDAPVYGHLLDRSGAPISTEQVASTARTRDRRWREQARAAARSYLDHGFAEQGSQGELVFPKLRSRQEGDDTAAERMRAYRQRKRYGTVTDKRTPLAVTQPLPVTAQEEEEEGEPSSVYTEASVPGRAPAHEAPPPDWLAAAQAHAAADDQMRSSQDQDLHPIAPAAVIATIAKANGSEGELGDAITRLHQATGGGQRALDAYHDFANRGVTPPAFHYAREVVDELKPDNPAGYAITCLRDWEANDGQPKGATPTTPPPQPEEEPHVAKAKHDTYVPRRVADCIRYGVMVWNDLPHLPDDQRYQAALSSLDILDGNGGDAQWRSEIMTKARAGLRAAIDDPNYDPEPPVPSQQQPDPNGQPISPDLLRYLETTPNTTRADLQRLYPRKVHPPEWYDQPAHQPPGQPLDDDPFTGT